ncbi:hypothetical protein [Kribbella sp. NPDC055071]
MPLHPAFVDQLSRRIAAYTGGDITDRLRIAAGLRADESPGDGWQERVATYMLEDVRRRLAEPAGNRYDYLHREVTRVLHDGSRISVSAEDGPGFVHEGQAAGDASRVFYAAAAVIEPDAQDLAAPLALERQRTARFAGAVRVLGAFPEDQTQRVGQFQRWATEAERLRNAPAGSERLEDRTRLAADFDQELKHWAGVRRDNPRTSKRSPEDSLRNGAALSEVGRVKSELAQELGIADAIAGIELPPSDRFEGPMVEGLTAAVAERTGRSEDEVVQLLCSTGGHGDQWGTVSRLLISDEALAQADQDGREPRAAVKHAMQDEFSTYYGNPDKKQDLAPEVVGRRIIEAGVATASRHGIEVSRPDPTLDATMAQASAGMAPAGSRSAYPALTDAESSALGAVLGQQDTSKSVTRSDKSDGHTY